MAILSVSLRRNCDVVPPAEVGGESVGVLLAAVHTQAGEDLEDVAGLVSDGMDDCLGREAG